MVVIFICTKTAASASFSLSSRSIPTYRISESFPMVVTCSAKSMERSMYCPCSSITSCDVIITCVGRCVFLILVVIGTTVMISECWLAVSLLIMSAGRHPSWTLVPGWVPNSANHISPRCGDLAHACSVESVCSPAAVSRSGCVPLETSLFGFIFGFILEFILNFR